MMTLTEAIEALLLATRADGRSESTVTSYRSKLGHLVDFLGGDVPIEAITVQDLRRYIVDLQDRERLYEDHPHHAPRAGQLSPFTINSYVRSMKRLFNFLEEEGVIETNPVRRIKTPRASRDVPHAISAEDFLALLKSTEGEGLSDRRDRAIILFLGDTGCRVSGLCGLRIEDVNLEDGVAFVREKGADVRPVVFGAITAAALRAWLAARPTGEERGAWLFVSLSQTVKGQMTRGAVAKMLKRRAQRLGIEGRVNPHSLRHAFAREYLLNGGDLGTLADLMGHSSVEVTKSFYAIFTIEELKKEHDKYSPISNLLGGDTDDNDNAS
jgi:site-specific recombinase XerD